MKKLAILALAGLVLATTAAPAAGPAVNNQTDCNSNHMKCREYTLNLDEPWYKVMVLLTACAVALGKCLWGVSPWRARAPARGPRGAARMEGMP
jgi:hypothetical protein